MRQALPRGWRVFARILLVLVALVNQWTVPLAFAAYAQESQEQEPLPQASTVTAIPATETTTFIDATLIGKAATDVVGQWIRVFTEDKPAGLIIQVIGFNSNTGALTLADPIPAGGVKVNDVYHLASSRNVLLPTTVDPSTIFSGRVGCAPAGTDNANEITCFALDTTGVDAKKGNDTVAVTSPTVVLVTKFGSKDENASDEDKDTVKTGARAIDLGDGNDQVVTDGTVVSAAVALVSESPKNPFETEETKAAARAEPKATGISGGDGQNIITNNGTLSTSATALLLARQIPGEAEKQTSVDVSSTATATSSGIESGDDGAFVTNTGRVVSRAIAGAAGVGISASAKGKETEPGGTAGEPPPGPQGGDFTFKGDVKATADATGITVGSGNDTITNTDEIVVTGWATSLAGGLTTIGAKGSAGATATSTAASTAQGLALGDGNDTVINNGDITVSATSRAIALQLAIADKSNTPPSESGSGGTSGGATETPKPEPLSSSVEGSVTATAAATGITADGDGTTPENGEPVFDTNGRIAVGRTSTETHANGNDAITNTGTLGVAATARSTVGSAGITIGGDASTKATSTATATSLGIDLGAGDDTLTNSGAITSTADALARAVSVAVAQKASSPTPATPPEGGVPADEGTNGEKNTVAIKSVVEGSATATSTATGITADGEVSVQSETWLASISPEKRLEYTQQNATTRASGVDVVTNSGEIGVTATSFTRAVSGGIAIDGATTAKVTSTADATALGIDLGGGNDTLTNTSTGALTATADATANALAIAVGLETDESAKPEISSAADTSASATAHATGVSADGLAESTTRNISLGLGGGQGLSILIVKTTTQASGGDTIANDGTIAATATATSDAIGVAVTVEGKATTNAKSEAESTATAIDLGAGNDTLTNTGSVAATATSTATALGIAVGLTSDSKKPASTEAPPAGGAGAADGTPGTPASVVHETTTDASATAKATAIGVTAEGALADRTQSLQIQVGGNQATFIRLQDITSHASGNDALTNSGTVDATATATTEAIEIGVTIDGKAAAKVASTAEALATAIDLGGGNDTLTNTAGATLTVTSAATARALAVSVGASSDPAKKSGAQSAVDASVAAQAHSIGIAADAAEADTTIDLTIKHLEGVLSIDAQVSNRRASGDDTVTNHAGVTSTATATTEVLSAGITIDGAGASSKNTSTAGASAVAIDLGGGNDTLTDNTGHLTAFAGATANALGIAVAIKSSSGSSGGTPPDPAATPTPTPAAATMKTVAEGSVTARSNATGVAADSTATDTAAILSLAFDGLRPGMHVEMTGTRASGDDDVTNNGAIDATAEATSRAGAVSAATSGAATARMTSTAEAAAAGIDLGGGSDLVTNNGNLTATATATALGLNVAVVPSSSSSGSSGSGSSGTGTPVPSRAKSSADGSATADARATGLAADSTSGDTRLTIDLTVGDDLFTGAVFGFLKSETRASGDDTVTNTGAIEARATANTGAASVAFSTEGSASTKTSSSAEAAATAIDLGGGADLVDNSGALTAIATALSGGLSVAFTNKGTATGTDGTFAASEGLWKGGIEATAAAFGIDGAGAATTSTSLGVTLNGIVGIDVRFEKLEDNVTADLADTITNRADITAEARATAGTINVSASAEGSAAAVSDIESKATATGIRGGQGDDAIDNLGLDKTTTVTATALTGAITVAVSGKGAAVAADTLWSTGTQAEAAAIGIDGDGGIIKSTLITVQADLGGAELVIEKKESGASGNDTITNEQALTVTSSATAPSIAVSLEAKRGVAATISSVESSATATGIRGGGGDDVVTNHGALVVNASALSAAAAIAIAKEGVAAAGGAIWDGGTKAEATAVGIDADAVSTTTRTTTLTVDGNGVTIEHKKIEDTVAGAGTDSVINHAAITATAAAETDTLSIAATAKGVSASFGQSTAESTAVAIRGGAGDDTLTNYGALAATATSIARALNLSLVIEKGLAIAGNGVWDGGTTAEARAVGISGDGGTTRTSTTTISVGGGGDLVDREKTDLPATGNDTIGNTGTIDVLADADTLALAGAVSVTGAGLAISTSTANAFATAIEAAGGADTVINSGTLTSTANATAVTANIAFAKTGLAVAADAVWDGGTTATAVAKGIDGGQSPAIVTNDGAVTAIANAAAGSVSAAFVISGVAAATSTATAVSRAVGIETGDSDDVDVVTNTGALTATSDAMAGAVSLSFTNSGLAVSADSVWSGGTTADAAARGISVSGGADTVINHGRIEAGASAETGSVAASVTISGVAGGLGTATANALAIAIDAGAGADSIVNRGRLFGEASTLAGAVSVGVSTAGVAVAGNNVWDGGTSGIATARTIDAGDGNDTVTNDGDVDATSTATTASVSVAVAVSGVGAAISTSTATSAATAIDGGSGNNIITNRVALDPDTGLPIADRTGALVATATANAATVTVSVTTAGVVVAADVWDGGTTADADARGIRTELGNDTITNDGAIEATSTARAGSVGASVSGAGVAVALANATADSTAIAIAAGDEPGPGGLSVGDDSDTVTNTGALTADAIAFAVSVPVSVTPAGVSVSGTSVFDGGTTARSMATGIATGAGVDTIDNSGTIDASAQATSGTASVTVAVAGVAASVATSTAIADAVAIDAGAGDDTITNSARLTTDTLALAGTVSVGVTTAGASVVTDSVWDGGTKGTAASRTIAAGAGADTVTNTGDLDAIATAGTTSVGVSVAVAGVAAAVAVSTATARATAIDAGDGDDTVTNTNAHVAGRTGKLLADATATATALSVSVAPAGVAGSADSIWDGGTTAQSAAAGIDTGLGADTVVNASEITANSTAHTASVSAAVTVFGVAAAVVSSTAIASATAIRTGDDIRDDNGAAVDPDAASEVDVVTNTGKLTAAADVVALSAGVGFAFGGVTGVAGNWDSGTVGSAFARGVALGNGADWLTNSGEIKATSFANSDDVKLGITVYGVSAAASKATAEAFAWAVDGGDGNDTIANLAGGLLTAEATSVGVGVSVSFVAIGATAALDTLWTGGTVGNAVATGIFGGLGLDRIENDAAIDTTADATTVSVAVSITGIGAGAALATSTATATAIGIDGGDDADVIVNRGDVTSRALSTATGVSVSATGIGAGSSFDGIFDNGTDAASHAIGLSGGAGDDVILHLDKTLKAEADADARSSAVAVTVVGVAGTSALSTATARATGVDGGDGADTIVVDSDLVSIARSTASATSVSVAGGVSIAGSFGNATTSEAIATGVAGGAGADIITLTENAVTTLTSDAKTTDTAVAVTLAIFGAANSEAVALARATGIDGGDDDDTIDHDGVIRTRDQNGVILLTAEARSRAVTVNYAGGAAFADASARSEVVGVGIDGGAGNDTVVNRGLIDLAGTATARGSAIAFTGTGFTNADATSVSDAALTGIQGGDGDDTLTNATGARVDIRSTGEAIAIGKAVTVTGAALSDAQTTPTATATGLDGGAGDDTVINNGTIAATATATSTSTSSSTTIFGGAASSAGTIVTATATGLAGGLGADVLLNRAEIIVNGVSSASANGSSWVLGGGAGDSSVFNATGTATGMAGGVGRDVVRNLGVLGVTFESSLTATGGSDAIFGGATASTQLTATGGSVGITGDADDDDIQNLGIINVTSTAGVSATKATVSFAGSPTNDALLSAHATAMGLDGGSGHDVIRNSGTLTVRADGRSNVSGGAEATILGGTKSNGAGTANATATGIQGDAGDNVIVSAGLLDVLATGDAVTANSSDSGLLFSQGQARSDARSTVLAFGIDSGLGGSSIVNDDDLTVKADASAYAYTSASGAHISIQGAATARSVARAFSTAFGVRSLDGANTIVNRGLLSVLALAGTTRDLTRTESVCSTAIVETQVEVLDADGNPVLDEGDPTYETIRTEVATCEEQEFTLSSSATHAGANGNGAAGVGTANATAETRADASGIHVGDGANVIGNTGTLEVIARPDARSTVFADGDLLADAHGTATSTAAATAVGISAGDGNNEIANTGIIRVLAAPEASATANVTAGDICIFYLFGTWCGGGGHGFATAAASVSATAVGIQVGGGDNLIVNDGLLTVTAAPRSAATQIPHGDTVHHTRSIVASATGIQAGNGDNTIVNTAQGVIDVRAEYTAASASLTAVGILTGSGRDTIVNDGLLSASIVSSSGTQFTTAIDAGAGNDRVVLGSDSVTRGAILLGDGDDRFVWSAGASLTGLVTAGAGFDTFSLGGSREGTLNLSASGPIAGMDIFTDFEDFRKEGSSLWTLTGARAMDWTVEGGTLAVAGVVTGTVATEAAEGSATPTVAVTPTGTIARTDAAPAIVLQTGGRLINEGSVATAGLTGVAVQAFGADTIVVNDGQISGPRIGVELTGANAVMSNSGSVLAGTDAAIVMDGSHNTLLNDGDIQGLGLAVVANGLGAVVINDGAIAATSTALLMAGAGSALTNGGTLTGGSLAVESAGGQSVVVNTGLIDAAGTAVKLGGDRNVVDNDGVITAGDVAVMLGGPASALTNRGTLTGGSLAVEGTGGQSAIVNTGLIDAAGTAVKLGGDRNVVDNDGVITAGDVAVMLGGPASALTNRGTLTGGSLAVEGTGGQSVIVNEGVLRSAGTALALGGADNLVQNDGDIVGGVAGVAADGAALVVTNAGSIAANGVALQSAGGQSVIVNTGLIDAAGMAVKLGGGSNVLENDGIITAGDVAVMLGNGDALTNRGTIASTNGLAILGGAGSDRVINDGVLAGGAGFALDLGAGDDELTLIGGSLINGVAHGGAGTDTLIFGGTAGVLDVSAFRTAFTSFEHTAMRALSLTIVGSGALDLTVEQGTLNILGDVTGTIESGVGTRGVEIVVQSSGRITGDRSAAVVLGGTANSLFNAGTIEGAIHVSGDSSILNRGVIENPDGVAIIGDDGAQRVQNDGLISGLGTAIDFGGGDDLLQLSTTAGLRGWVRGGAGFDTLGLVGAGGALDLNTFDAFELLQKDGSGLWMLTGSSDMAWHIMAGGLVVNGDLAGSGFVQEGALLAGNGLVGGFTNAGTVSPGMSIGTLGVVGNYVQTSSGTLEVEASIESGYADRLNVSGRATLDGTLAVLPEARDFGIATEYTVLEALGGVSGTFASTTSALSNLDLYVDYLPQSVVATLVRNDVSFASMAGAEHLRAFGESLDANKRSMARGDFKNVMDQFLAIDPDAQASALRTLSGELHAALPTTLLRTGERFFSASATRRLSAQQAGNRVTAWTDFVRFSGDVHRVNNATGLSYGTSGLVGGVDVTVGRGARIGASLGYARARNELHAVAADNASVRSLMPAVYGEVNAGAFTVQGAYGYGEHDVQTARSIQVGAVARQASADYKADQHSGLLRLGVAVPTRPALSLVPFVELRYSALTRQAFDERGAESTNLTGIGAFEVESFRTLVGMRTAWTPMLFGKRVEPVLSLAWTREGLDARGGMRATLSGVTARPGFQAFTLGGVPEARYGALIDTGVAIVLGTHGRAFVAYDSLLTDTRTERGLQIGGKILW